MSRQTQRGATLISTMIGLLLGLFAVLSVMTLYKTQVNQTFQTRTNSSIDGQAAAALIATQLEVQRAGFGVEVVAAVSPAVTADSCLGVKTAGPNGTANADVVLLSGATLTGSTLAGTAQTIGTTAVTGNAVVWRSVDATLGSTCSGFIAVGGGLKQLPSVACTDATSWASRTWTAASVQDVVVPGTLSVSGKAMAFSALMTSCTPYGRGTSSPALQLTTTVGQSTDGITSSVVSCIPNICKQNAMKKYSRNLQRGAINILLVGLAGIGVMALTAANLNTIRGSQDQQFSLHTNTQATANAWDGVELFRLYLLGLSSTDLAALAPGAVAITGVSNLAASVVSNVTSGTAGRRITANITGTGAGSSATVQVVYDVSPGGTSTAPVVPNMGVVNINSNLKLSGSIKILGGTAAQLWVNGDVDLTGSVTGVDLICSTGNVIISSAITVNKVCSNGTLKLEGAAKVITVESVGNVILSGGAVDITTLTSNGDVTVSGGSAKVGTLNASGAVAVSGGGATVTGDVNAKGAVTWTSSVAAKTINSNGNVTYKAGNNNTVINSQGNVTLSGNGNVQNITAMGNVFLQSGYGLGVEGTLLGGGTLNYNSNIKAVAGKVKGAISGPAVFPWSPVMNVTRDTSLAVNVPPVSVATLSPILMPSSSVDVYALKPAANYVFDIEAGTGYKQVTVKNVAGITDGTYYLGNYPYVWNVTELARGNYDYLCTAVNSSGICTAPALPYKTLCEGYGGSYTNSCFSYNAGTKIWTIAGETMAPGFAWFEGGLNVSNGIYVNTFAASGHITTSGATVVYAPNYVGYDSVCSQTSGAPGNRRGSRLSGLVPSDVCNIPAVAAVAATSTTPAIPATAAVAYAAPAIGNVALVAGGYVGGVFQGGDITLGSSSDVYGGVIAGNLLKTGGSTVVHGAVQSAGQGSSSNQTTTWTGSTTIDLRNTASSYTPGGRPCMVNCNPVPGPANASIFWTRYL